MNLDYPSKENLSYILDSLAVKLSVANRSLFDPEDYDIQKYDDLKLMHDMVMNKDRLSAPETQAFIDELRTVRKN
ncbi:MAG TPA: DUF1128 domain-containing protein [Virgibacillus sp.]|nr:DUF1128 domain-containing protein [Virgibacillus sp.]